MSKVRIKLNMNYESEESSKLALKLLELTKTNLASRNVHFVIENGKLDLDYELLDYINQNEILVDIISMEGAKVEKLEFEIVSDEDGDSHGVGYVQDAVSTEDVEKEEAIPGDNTEASCEESSMEGQLGKKVIVVPESDNMPTDSTASSEKDDNVQNELVQSKKVSVTQHVREYFDEHQGVPANVATIAEAINDPETAIRAAIVTLYKSGEIKRVGRGKYVKKATVAEVTGDIDISNEASESTLGTDGDERPESDEDSESEAMAHVEPPGDEEEESTLGQEDEALPAKESTATSEITKETETSEAKKAEEVLATDIPEKKESSSESKRFSSPNLASKKLNPVRDLSEVTMFESVFDKINFKHSRDDNVQLVIGVMFKDDPKVSEEIKYDIFIRSLVAVSIVGDKVSKDVIDLNLEDYESDLTNDTYLKANNFIVCYFAKHGYACSYGVFLKRLNEAFRGHYRCAGNLKLPFPKKQEEGVKVRIKGIPEIPELETLLGKLLITDNVSISVATAKVLELMGIQSYEKDDRADIETFFRVASGLKQITEEYIQVNAEFRNKNFLVVKDTVMNFIGDYVKEHAISKKAYVSYIDFIKALYEAIRKVKQYK